MCDMHLLMCMFAGVWVHLCRGLCMWMHLEAQGWSQVLSLSFKEAECFNQTHIYFVWLAVLASLLGSNAGRWLPCMYVALRPSELWFSCLCCKLFGCGDVSQPPIELYARSLQVLLAQQGSFLSRPCPTPLRSPAWLFSSTQTQIAGSWVWW